MEQRLPVSWHAARLVAVVLRVIVSQHVVNPFQSFPGNVVRIAVANDNANTEPDQFVFNDIRLDLHGTLFDHYDFRFLPDFAGGKVVVQDEYVDVRYSNYLKVRVGKFKVPFGRERLQQDYATTFAQRGLPNNLVPNRDLGVQLFGEVSDGLLAYQAGVFNGVADGGSSDGDATDDKELAAMIKPAAGTVAKGSEKPSESGHG